MRLKDVATIIVGQSPPKHSLPSDVLVSMLAPVGVVNIADRGNGIGRGFCAIRANGADAGYLYWWMVNESRRINAIAAAVSRDDIAGLPLLVVSDEEQRAIADFLHRETAEIDAVIADQEELIALLGERRTAALARSLDEGWAFPTVPLKRLFGPDSLPEFLGVSGGSAPVTPAFTPRFADAVLRSPRLVAECRSRQSGAPRLGWDQLRDIRVPVPPIPEQNDIVERLDRETSEIDSVIADATEAIALSKERRSAMIAAAVTGTIDVRDERAA